MGRVYDNWGRLVGATLRREDMRISGQRTPSDVSLAPSSSSSFGSSSSSHPRKVNNYFRKKNAAEEDIMDALVGALDPELVKDAASAIQEQGRYAAQFPDQFNVLKEQMTFMQSFVADTRWKKERSETVEATIASMQELIYEADDLIIDCQIREDYEKKKGRSCFPSLSELSFRLEAGKKLAHINSDIERMKKNFISYYSPITTAPPGGDNILRKRRWSSHVFDQSEIVGLKEDAERIKDWIIHQREPLLHVGIVGLGGLGKTTLAKKIYNDPVLTRRYQAKIWVSVSQPVNVFEIMKSMLTQLGEKDIGSCESDMLPRIRKLLSGKPYLIILDDVWSTDDDEWWAGLSDGIPKTGETEETQENKNCIIITSRIQKVVREMGVAEENVHHPRLLDNDESWSLFCKVARISRDREPKELQDVGKEIVQKCGGLPLAIKTIGGFALTLSSQHQKKVEEWERISENFHAKLTEGSNPKVGDMSVIASLQLSYDELPAYLKPCLLCFSMYPEDQEIDVDQLIGWWAGEGFVRGDTEETVTEKALNCLSELINRCLVEVDRRRKFDASVYTCKVHDMVREMTIKIAREGGFCSFDKDGRNITDSGSRRLGVASHTKFQDLRGNSRLRALLLTATDRIGFSRDFELAKIHSLRVLDLSRVELASINLKDLWEWITSLKRLAYLNLREVAKLSEVPSSIAKLWGLQVLILEECRDLKKLPKSIVKLPSLILLNVCNCPQLKYFPQGFSLLSNLQELYGFKVGASANSGSGLGELEFLTELRMLQIDITEESEIKDEELQVLANHKKLKLLSINAGECQDSQENDILTQLGKLSPPSSLEELYLKHYLGETMPGWINPKSLPKLLYLCMEHARVSKISKDFWGVTGSEPTAKECKWDVEGLCLKFCQKLELSWDEVKTAMPKIRYLEISQCSSLKGFPCDVTVTGFWDKKDDKDITRRMLSIPRSLNPVTEQQV